MSTKRSNGSISSGSGNGSSEKKSKIAPVGSPAAAVSGVSASNNNGNGDSSNGSHSSSSSSSRASLPALAAGPCYNKLLKMVPLLRRVRSASAPLFANRFEAQINTLTSNAKLADRPRKIIVEGPQGTGKSTLLNAIVGHNVFPGTELTTSFSVTSRPLEVSFANQPVSTNIQPLCPAN